MATNVTLKEYMDERFIAVNETLRHIEKTINDKFEAQNAIRAKADEVLNERLSGMNKWREEEIADKALFMNRESCDQRMSSLEQGMTRQTKELAQLVKPLEARASFISGREATLAAIFTVVIVIVQIAMRFLNL